MVRITVDRQQILRNRSQGENKPVWLVERNGRERRVHGLMLNGKRSIRLVSAPGGTACWIEIPSK